VKVENFAVATISFLFGMLLTMLVTVVNQPRLTLFCGNDAIRVSRARRINELTVFDDHPKSEDGHRDVQRTDCRYFIYE
jgi:hypothetical protein